MLAVLLALTNLTGLGLACKELFDSVIHWTVATETLRVLNELLVVLMLAEISTHSGASRSALTFWLPNLFSLSA